MKQLLVSRSQAYNIRALFAKEPYQRDDILQKRPIILLQPLMAKRDE